MVQNFFPWLVTPKQQIQWLKMAANTVMASLFGNATSWTYLVNASLMQKMNIFPFLEVLRGPNRSVFGLGSVGCGRLDTRSGTRVECFLRI